MRLGQCIRRLRYCRCANHRVLEYSNLPLTRRVFLHHQGRPRLDVLFLAIEVPPQIGADKYHRHVRLQEAHLLDLKAVVAAFVDCVKNCAMDVLDVSTAVKELAEDVNQVGVSSKLRSPSHTVTVVPCLFEFAYDFQQGLHHTKADFGIIVSKGGFSKGAVDFAKDEPIYFLNTDDLVAMQEGRDVLAKAFVS